MSYTLMTLFEFAASLAQSQADAHKLETCYDEYYDEYEHYGQHEDCFKCLEYLKSVEADRDEKAVREEGGQ